MPLNREQEAGALYEEGSRHVRAGGDELHFIANHLTFMVRGTAIHKGPLWPLRVLHDGREIRLERFIDYLMKPTRVGLGLPSLHFLRQVLKATPDRGEEALALVRAELARELIDLDSEADREHETTLLKRKPGPTGVHVGGKFPPLTKHGTDREAARLADRRPDLADRVRAGEMKLATALREAGIRKPVTPLQLIRRAWKRASPEDRATFLKEIDRV